MPLKKVCASTILKYRHIGTRAIAAQLVTTTTTTGVEGL